MKTESKIKSFINLKSVTKMFKMNVLLSIAILIVIIVYPIVAFAGLVPCGLSQDDASTTSINESDPCSLCSLFTLLQQILDFLAWQIAPALAILIVAWGGFLILMSGANPGWKQSGIQAIRTAVIGLLIMFAGWVVVNEVLLYFSKSNQDSSGKATIFQSPWNKINCKS